LFKIFRFYEQTHRIFFPWKTTIFRSSKTIKVIKKLYVTFLCLYWMEISGNKWKHMVHRVKVANCQYSFRGNKKKLSNSFKNLDVKSLKCEGFTKNFQQRFGTLTFFMCHIIRMKTNVTEVKWTKMMNWNLQSYTHLVLYRKMFAKYV